MHLVNENFENMRCDYVLGIAIHDLSLGRCVRALVHMLRLKEKDDPIYFEENGNPLHANRMALIPRSGGAGELCGQDPSPS